MLHGLIIANADLSMFWLSNFYLFIYLLLRFAYGGVLLMTAFLKIYPIPKIRNIPIYRLAYSIAMYCNISYRNPCIVIRIVSPDSCQYTALVSYLMSVVFKIKVIYLEQYSWWQKRGILERFCSSLASILASDIWSIN